METKYKISEIFESIQGEGPWQGRWCTFIRFSGCNLSCEFCDTDHSLHGTLYETELVSAVAEHSPEYIVFTGGEPALQITTQLIDRLHKLHTFPEIAIETNGTLFNDAFFKLDHITVSPKTITELNESLKYMAIQELRILITPKTTESYVRALVHSFRSIAQVSLSPMFNPDGKVNNVALNTALLLVHSGRRYGIKLSMQLHKLIGVK